MTLRPAFTHLALAAAVLAAGLLCAVFSAQTAHAAISCPNANPVVQENDCMSGASGGWQLSNQNSSGTGDANHGPVGFAVQPSYNLGQDVQLKIASYSFDPVNLAVYRMGYYGGTGGRLVYSANNVAVANYANCPDVDPTTDEVACTNWSVSATIPGSLLPASGVYIVKLIDPATNAQNQILFVVRDDASTSPCLVKVPTATYQAYNDFGSKSLYDAWSSSSQSMPDLVPGHPRAHAVSFARPLQNVTDRPNFFLHDEYALVYWLEQQGYNCTYTDSTGIAENPSSLLHHKVIVVGGHDEYWSGGELAAFEAARNAGVSIASFSANTAYWKVQYEDNFQTIAEYKTIADGNLGVNDPGSDAPTTTFRDPGAPAGDPNAPPGGRPGPNTPENALWGELYVGDNDNVSYPLVVPPSDGHGNFAGNAIWRNTGIPSQGATIGTNLVGWEWDAVPSASSPLYAPKAAVQPAGVQELTQSPLTPVGQYEFLTDNGNSANYSSAGPPPGQPSASEAVMYTASSGAVVFSAGTIQWPWGLGPYWPVLPGGQTYFTNPTNTPDARIQQATYNILSDMGVQPATPVGLTLDPTGSTTTTGATTTTTGTGTTTTSTATTTTATVPTTTTSTTGTSTSGGGGSTSTPYAKAVLGTPGLINYWRMGDAPGSTSLSPAAGGVPASLSGGVTLGSGGALSGDPTSSATFDGSSGAASAPLNLSSDSAVTVEFWLNWKSYANNDALALEFTPNFNTNAGGFLVDPNASTGPAGAGFGVAMGQGASRNTIYFPRPSAGAWHLFTFVFNSAAPAASEVTPYVDGQPVAFTQSANGTGAGNFANSVLSWMSRPSTTLFGAGSVQDLAIYNQALPATTVQSHYVTGTGTTTTTTTTPSTTTASTTTTTPSSTTTTPSGGGGSTTTPYAKAVLGTPGLINYWRMGDAPGSTSLSPAAGGVAGTLSGGVTLGSSGALSGDPTSSATFDGSSGAASAPLNLSSDSAVTVEFWLNWKSYANNDALALEFTPNFNTNAGGFLVDPNAANGPDPGGDFGVAMGQGASRNTIYFPRPSAGAWHLFTFVFNSAAPAASEVTPYVDGQPVAFTQSANGTGAGNFANSVLSWMSRAHTTLFGAGSMQDLAIYN